MNSKLIYLWLVLVCAAPWLYTFSKLNFKIHSKSYSSSMNDYKILWIIIIYIGIISYSNQIPKIILFSLFVFAGLWILNKSTNKLLISNINAIRIIWYFYSLAFFLTITIGVIAVSGGHFDSAGRSSDSAGEIIEKIIGIVIALDHEIGLSFILALLIVVPQSITYLACAIWGCAGKVEWLSFSSKFFMWGTVKTLAITSGFLTGYEILIKIMSWQPKYLIPSADSLLYVIHLMASAISFAAIYFNFGPLKRKIATSLPRRIITFIECIDKLATRNVDKALTEQPHRI